MGVTLNSFTVPTTDDGSGESIRVRWDFLFAEFDYIEDLT